VKKIILPTLFILLTIVPACTPKTSGGEKTSNGDKEPKTKLEAFVAKTGVVILRGFEEIGAAEGVFSGSKVIVESKEFTDVTGGKNEKAYGITIEVIEPGTIEKKHTSYIDYDEIDSLVRGIEYIAKVNNTSTKLKSFQADYRTKGELVISTFNNKSDLLVAVSSGQIGGATAYFKLQDIVSLRNLIMRAKDKLATIKE
jgi:hypothetical protein